MSNPEEPNPQKTKRLAIIAVIVIALIGLFVLGNSKPANIIISSFDECVAAGHPVMESHPRQCRTPEGTLFIEDSIDIGDVATITPTGATSSNNQAGRTCRPTGCSGQICADEDIASTCEYQAAYTCYKTARCERQISGQCGWTDTQELRSCLANAQNEPVE